MSPRPVRYLAYGLVLLQAMLITAYTLPGPIVPGFLRTISIRCIRPLFHQQWNLFAPDPLVCAPEVQVSTPDGAWVPIVPADASSMHRRMGRPLAAMVQAEVERGDSAVHPIVAEALRRMCRDMDLEPMDLRFRLVEECVMDPARPEDRQHRITELVMPGR